MIKQTIDITDYLNAPAHEAFRVLSTNLNFNQTQKLKVISIVSFNPGEGKTCVALNLSIIAANSGNRVLCVDTDLRKPFILKRQGNKNLNGLTNFEENGKLDDIVCETGIENLHYVTPGNRLVDSVELLSSALFDEFLRKAADQYDMIVLDSPSMGNYVDGAIIASKASGVLIISQAEKTSYKNIDRVKWHLKNVGAHVIGVVINQVSKREYKSYFLLNNSFKYFARNDRRLELNK